jgi:hypothetical protein
VAISSVLLSVVLPTATALAATPTNRSHWTESSRPAVSQGISVCGFVNTVDRLTVTRSHPGNPETFTFSAMVKTSSKLRIRALAKALCALPSPGTGTYHCPADYGPHYTLNFVSTVSDMAAAITPVVVQATGCESVKGLTPTRWIALTPSFWGVLGVAIGLPHATRSTFAGKLTSNS